MSENVAFPAAASASRGVIYLASGGRSYLGELMTSLESLRRHEPDLPVTIFSPFKPPRSAKAQHVHYDSLEHPLKQKVLVLQQSPYEETLFLDTDTSVMGKLTPVFDYLRDHDFAVANMFEADWTVRPPRLLALTKIGEYNTGVLLFNKSPGARRFLHAWWDAIMPQDPKDMFAGHNCDQQYFNRIVEGGAMDACGTKFAVLPNTIYNVRGSMVDEIKRLGTWDQVRILHHRTRRMKLRKGLLAITDWGTAREVIHKVLDRIGEKLKPQKSAG